MKLNPIIVSIIVGALFFLVVGVLAFYNVIPFQPLATINGTPRRYISLEPWHNFNRFQITADFDFVFTRTIYLLFVLQSFVLINKLEMRNIFLVTVFVILTIAISFGLFSTRNLTEYSLTGMNPIFMNFYYVMIVTQVLISIYLNVMALRKLSLKGTKKTE